MATAEAIAEALGNNEQDGKNWRCTCPLCGRSSLALQDRDARLLIKCWNGCDSKAIRAELKRRKLYASGNGSGSATRPETRTEHEDKIATDKAKRRAKRKNAQWCWDTSVAAADTLVEVYLASRLILNRPPPPALRLCTAYRPKSRINQPHVIGLIEHETEGVIGAHMIALNPLDASVRVSGEDRKWSMGNVKGGAVRLFSAGPTLALAEGIEDAMVFTEATGIPCWATISAEGIRNFVPPPASVTNMLLLLEDQDPNQVGQRAVADACPRLAAAGYRVTIVRPRVGKDLNDALLQLGPGADLFTTEDYEPNRAGDWYGRCTFGDNGKPLSNFSNALLALREDPAWRGVLAFDDVAALAMVLRPLPRKGNGSADYPRRTR